VTTVLRMWLAGGQARQILRARGAGALVRRLCAVMSHVRHLSLSPPPYWEASCQPARPWPSRAELPPSIRPRRRFPHRYGEGGDGDITIVTSGMTNLAMAFRSPHHSRYRASPPWPPLLTGWRGSGTSVRSRSRGIVLGSGVPCASWPGVNAVQSGHRLEA